MADRTSPPRAAPAAGTGGPPLWWFALLAFPLPWAGWLALGRWGWDRPWSMPLFVGAGAFCSLGGGVALCRWHGLRGGLQRLRAALRPRGGIWPWAMVLLWGPVWQLAAGAGWALWSGDAGPWRGYELARFMSPGVAFLLLTGPLGEEFGWRGFLLPWLMQRLPAGRAAVAVGVVWALWHTPLMAGRWAADAWHLPYFVTMVVLFSWMLATVALQGGLLPALALHWAINASQEVVPHVFQQGVEPPRLAWAFQSASLLALVAVGLACRPRDAAGRRTPW